MRNGFVALPCALLGSAVAFAAVSTAANADTHADWKKQRAIEGNRAHIARSVQNGAAGLSAADGTYTDLHDFNGTDGQDPTANVSIDDAGTIYGNAEFGGANGDGVVFQLTADGTYSILHSFNGNDGSEPDGGMVLMPNGTLYGTGSAGGSSGNGVLFKISKGGSYKVLHDFGSNDGSFLRGDLIRDKEGSFYGTGLFGGVNGDGTVYKYGFDGTFTVLHAFNGADGEFPEHGVVRDSAGNLYGVTAFGGANDNGSVYKLTPDGTMTTLHSFTGNADGGFLYGGLAIDKDGTLYGSTTDGGANSAGTVFKITSDGTFSTLYNFTGGADGGAPEGNMLLAGKNLYSTSTEGGDPSCLCGTVYEITSKGKAKVLHAFTSADGGGYSAGVVKHNGTFYGTTASYGANSDGVVFSLTKK